MKVVLISGERWDHVWRRNQHIASELVRQGFATKITVVEPPARGPLRLSPRPVDATVTAVAASAPIPKTLGGLSLLGRHIRDRLLRDADLLWINDPTLGVHCLHKGLPAIYDVTDDWRCAGFPSRIVRRIARAEDGLAPRARTIVCSNSLRERWQERYDVDAPVVHNGIDLEHWREAAPRHLLGAAPHVGYVGTLHEHRLDVDLVTELARSEGIGTVHLVGPDCLASDRRRQLEAHPKIKIHGAVPAEDVPSWMVAMDLLISPHLVNPFTLSLDAIKAYEYAASGRPVVATPTSGFVADPGRVTVVESPAFARACEQVCRDRDRRPTPVRASAEPWPEEVAGSSWAERAREFWGHAVHDVSPIGRSTIHA